MSSIIGAPKTQNIPGLLCALYRSGEYSDLAIKGSMGKVWKVHRAIVCPQARPLAINIDYQCNDEKMAEIDLSEHDSSTLERFITFLYTGNFDENASKGYISSTTLSSTTGSETLGGVSSSSALSQSVSTNVMSDGTEVDTKPSLTPNSILKAPPVSTSFGVTSLPSPSTDSPAFSVPTNQNTEGPSVLFSMFSSGNAFGIPNSSGNNILLPANSALKPVFGSSRSPGRFGNGSVALSLINNGIGNTTNSVPSGAGYNFPQISFNAQPLVVITKVYAMAEKYDVQPLKHVAAQKYAKILPNALMTSQFIESLRIMYEDNSSAKVNDILRLEASKFAGRHAKQLMAKQEFVSLCRQKGDLATDVLRGMLAAIEEKAEPKPGLIKLCPKDPTHTIIPSTPFCGLSSEKCRDCNTFLS
ncbi:hypothetical protein B0O99DRAFT_719030 [Bisporella sp. PMI_857]|nr:hypothetical protein B0O99DRAFT_719030 [Bisporella sp. PMI_857]